MTTPEDRKLAKNPDTPPQLLKELSERSAALSRLVARNPKTPLDLLEELSRSEDKTTRKWVALHAATPSTSLIDLASEFPVEVLENPIFDFLILENPNFFEEMRPAILRSLVKREQLPTGLIKHASKIEDESVQLAILQNSNLPKDAIAELIDSEISQHVVDMAKRHVNAPKKLPMSS